MLSYRESIIATAERHGWHVHEEDGALVVTDGHSTVRHILNGYASGEYYARKHYEDPHWCEVRAYEEEAPKPRAGGIGRGIPRPQGGRRSSRSLNYQQR